MLPQEPRYTLEELRLPLHKELSDGWEATLVAASGTRLADRRVQTGCDTDRRVISNEFLASVKIKKQKHHTFFGISLLSLVLAHSQDKKSSAVDVDVGQQQGQRKCPNQPAKHPAHVEHVVLDLWVPNTRR